MTIDSTTAIKLAKAEMYRISGDGMEIISAKVVERPWGWYIPWMASEDIETGNPPAPGIAPFLVLRESGQLSLLRGAAFSESVLRILGKEDGEELLSYLKGRDSRI